MADEPITVLAPSTLGRNAPASGRQPPAAHPLRALAAALAVLVGALAPAAVLAQDDPQLPSLTPRVFESRGTIAVNLPDIQRQPLTGFGPPPRTYVVPAEREPVSQPFTPDLDALPAYALDVPPEPVSDLDDPRRLRAEGGVGSQIARYGRFDLSTTGAAGVFFVDADYDGVSGQDNDGRVHFDRLDVRAGGQSFLRGRVRIEGHALLDGYRTPEANFDPRSRRRALGAEAGVGGVGAIPYRLAVRFEQSTYRPGEGDEVSEGRLDGEAQIGFLDDRLRLDAAGGIAGAGSVGTDARYGAVGAAVALGRSDGARLVVGVRGLAFDASAEAGGGDGQRLGPILDLQLPLGPAARVFVTNDPRLDVRSLADVTGLNPYLASDPLSPVITPDMIQVDARAGVEVRRGPVRLRGFATALRAPTYLTFGQQGDGLYVERYVRATAYGVGGDATVATASGVSVSAGVEARTSSTDVTDDLPYYAPLVGRAGLQVPFLDGRGRLGVSAYAESGRPTFGFEDAPAFGLVSFDASYDVAGPFSAVLRGERLVGEVERWPGFPEVPYAVMLGVRFSR